MSDLERVLCWMVIQAAYAWGDNPVRFTFIPWQHFVDARWVLRCDFYVAGLTD